MLSTSNFQSLIIHEKVWVLSAKTGRIILMMAYNKIINLLVHN